LFAYVLYLCGNVGENTSNRLDVSISSFVVTIGARAD